MTGAALGSVNCTSCGAGLSVLGGGRVLSHVCGYCGAVLDAQDGYKKVADIGKRNHPDSPVQIGMTVTLEGVTFTVIGTLGVMERYEGQVWKWVEHQVFSPTHGYLWLSVEEGQLTYTRKVRDFNMQHWLTATTVERSETPPVRTYRGARYKYYETSVTQIDFMEGEFNWVPRLGEKKTVVSLLGPDAMLSLVKSKTEREVELTRLLPRAQTAQEMGFDERALGPIRAMHPLTPYKPLREEDFLGKALAVTAALALVLGLVFWMNPGRIVLWTGHQPLASLPAAFEFEVSNSEQLAQLEFETTFSNQWAMLNAEIRGQDNEVVFSGARTVSFYSGRSGGENWSEGSRSASLRFRPPAEGVYSVSLSQLQGSDTNANTVGVRVSEGKPTGAWALGLAVLAGLGWLLVSFRRAKHFKNRMAGSDWHD